MNYVPEIRNGCGAWEQAFRCYCVHALISSDVDRWAKHWLELAEIDALIEVLLQ